jgi:hypothetical protein
MKRIVRLTESDLTRIVRRVISEQEQTGEFDYNAHPYFGSVDIRNAKGETVSEGFYKSGTSQEPDGSKIIVGKTFRDDTKGYTLYGYCKDKKTTKLSKDGRMNVVTVLSPEWQNLC